MFRQIAVWLLILALAVSCGSSSDISPLILAAKGGTSNGDDGSLTLEIPPGALAEDTEIRVSRVIEADLNREEIPELAKYILEPAGTVFSKPVRLSIELPLSILDSGFSVLHSLAEDPDDLDLDQDPSVAVELDDLLLSEDGSEATLMMQISHFSTITVIKGPVKTTLSVPDIADVGVPFSARAITSTIGIDGRVESREEFPNVGGVKGQNTVRTVTITVRPESPWDLTGNFWAPIPKPESTEGRPWGQPLKKPAGAPLNLG